MRQPPRNTNASGAATTAARVAASVAARSLLLKLSPLLAIAGLVLVVALMVLAMAKSKNTAAAAALCAPTLIAQQGERPGSGVGQSEQARREIPQELMPIYLAASTRYRLGADGWSYLAAINKIETSFGTDLNTSSAGAIGWMQFMPATWAAYGVDADGDGRRDPSNPRDAIHAAANYLRASGAPSDWSKAIYAYNHADWYVADVKKLSAAYRGSGSTVQVSDGAQLNSGRRATAPPPTNPAQIALGATYAGYASIYGNDPTTGFVDHGDNNIPRLPGASNDLPGIAVYNDATLGGWWSVEDPDGTIAILQQTDYGPSASGRDGVRRTVDINSVAARVAFGLDAPDFPTDRGIWTITYLGKNRPQGAVGADTGAASSPATACLCPASPVLGGPGAPTQSVPDANGGYGFSPAPGKDFSTSDEPEIARRADALGKALNLRLTGISGRRTPERNQVVGGATRSAHLTGRAADIDGIQEVPEETLRRYGLHRPIPGRWRSPTDGRWHDERSHITLAPGTENLTPAEALNGTIADQPAAPTLADPCTSSPDAQLVEGAKAQILADGTAAAPADAPAAIKAMIAAGNRLLRSRYRYGGAHGEPLEQVSPGGYDCSSAVSFVLHAGAKLGAYAWASPALMSYGAPGPGRWVTIYAHGGHAYMEVAGIRFDTSRVEDTGPRRADSGPRWRTPRGHTGFTIRHPEGL